MNKLTGLLLLSASILTMNALAAAATTDTIVTKSQVVRFNDLNLASEAGAQTLYKRITQPPARYAVTQAIASAIRTTGGA
ncbi:MAG: UrcA family protein [Gammaproteobacteria bacterium]